MPKPKDPPNPPSPPVPPPRPDPRNTNKEPLTAYDRGSAAWHKLVTIYEAKLQTLRMQNDTPKDELETAKLRGRIAEVKEFLAMGNTTVIDESDDFTE